MTKKHKTIDFDKLDEMALPGEKTVKAGKKEEKSTLYRLFTGATILAGFIMAVTFSLGSLAPDVSLLLLGLVLILSYYKNYPF